MSEELLLNDRRGNLIQGLEPRLIFLYGCKTFPPLGFQPLTARSSPTLTIHCATNHLPLLCCSRFYISNKLYFGAIDHSKMKSESVKKSLEKSKNVLEEKRKIVQQKNCIQKDTHVYNNCYAHRSRAIKKLSKNMNTSQKTTP